MLKNKILSASGGGVDPIFSDDVFATHLYTGNGTAQTINNGVDLLGKGGLVWEKPRSISNDHFLTTGSGNFLRSNTTGAQGNTGSSIYTFNNTGYVTNSWNTGVTVASWTFREAEKFFDVVTWTGNGSNPRAISHSLGSVPGFIIIKCTSTGATDWFCYHRSLANTQSLNLNQTGTPENGTAIWGSTTPTSTTFTVGNSNSNGSGRTYVAYLFAHNAGGFGATGNDNVISCGSYTGNGTTSNIVNLGYEPQWLIIKNVTTGGYDWQMYDNMRGLPVGGNTQLLRANLSDAELTDSPRLNLLPTGFELTTPNTSHNASGNTYIYIAIRRQHKPPTSGTQVFAPTTYTGTGTTNQTLTTNFPVDMYINLDRTNSSQMTSYAFPVFTRLLSLANANETASTDNWGGGWGSGYWRDDLNTGLLVVGSSGTNFNNQNGVTFVNYNFRRAPGFFDVVCYTGTGNGQVINHNLGVVPELAIFRQRAGASNVDWVVRPPGTVTDRFLNLNLANAQSTAANWYSATSTQITFPTSYGGTAASGSTYVAYLFASLPGISQVGTYTGNGSSQTINCGFAAGARFVMIKRTDNTGAWYVWDTARGIVSGNDPRLSLNVAAAEVTTDDSIDPDSSGFIVNQLSATNINVNAATYIFLAIA